MPAVSPLATSARPERPLHRLRRWLVCLGLVLAGGTGYACGVSCTKAQPRPEPAGTLVAAPLATELQPACV